MSLVTLLGWAAAGFGAFFTMPQFVRVLRTKNTAGLSLVAWQLQCAVVIAWAAHGIIYAMPNQIAANALVTFASAGVLWFIVQQRGHRAGLVIAQVAAVAGLLIAVDLIWGQLAFGLVILAPGCAGLAAQLVQLVRASDIGGVSPGFLVLGLVIQSLWLSWSLLIGDPSVTVTAAAAWLLLAANLGVWRGRMVRARRQVDAWAPARPATSVAA